jgi:uncharacterized protein DUF6644
MNSFLESIQATGLATTVKESLLLTGALSAVHLLGFTLVTGGALVSNLRLLGALFPQRPIVEISRPASRGIAAGLVLSMTTGLLLFAPRAMVASANNTFQLKMLLLLGAATFHLTLHRGVAQQPSATPGLQRLIGGVGLALWLGLALAGCAYILLE